MHVCVRSRVGSTRASSMKTANAYGWPECQIPRHSAASVIRLSCARVFYIQSSKPDARNSARNSTNPRIHESTNPRILFDEARFNNQLTDTHSDVRWSNLFAGLIKREYNHAANQTLTSFVDIAAIERFEMAYRVSPVFCDINVTDTVGCTKPSFCIRRVDKSRCQSCRFLVSASRIECA